MDTPKIVDAMGHIDDELVAAAEKKSKPWLKWSAVAACLVGLTVAAIMVFPLRSDRELPMNLSEGRYKDYSIQSGEAAIVWSWEDKTIYEQYTGVSMDGIMYRSTRRSVSEEFVGNPIGIYSVEGYEEISGKQYASDFEVYSLKYADQSQYVAVKMDENWYVFKNDNYNPPKTLGELFELIDFPQVIELSRFSENGDNSNGKYYLLDGDDYVWDVLATCRTAPFVEKDMWMAEERDYLSFTVTSETLGVYKVAMYVTEDGYLWTNAFSWAYLFDIGEAAAEKIIQYARSNSVEAANEPYQNTVAGVIAEITDEYILLDDSVLCRDPADGVRFKILLQDLRIARYVTRGVVKVGDTVQITYEGELDGDIIDSAIYLSRVTISEADILVLE